MSIKRAAQPLPVVVSEAEELQPGPARRLASQVDRERVIGTEVLGQAVPVEVC